MAEYPSQVAGLRGGAFKRERKKDECITIDERKHYGRWSRARLPPLHTIAATHFLSLLIAPV